MSTETPADAAKEPAVDLKKFGDEFSESLKKITNNLNEVREDLKEIRTKPEEKKDDHEDEFLFEDKDKIERLLEKKLEERDKKQKQSDDAKNAYEKACQEWDQKAYAELPQIKDPTIEKIVLEELNGMPVLFVDPSTGKKKYAPDAVYNAAHRVKAKNPKLFDQVLEDLDTGSYQKKIKGVDITDVQLQVAALMGISEDRARDIYKKHNESGRKLSRK